MHLIAQRGWLDMADLAQVNGIGPKTAKALNAAGIEWVHDLIRRSTATIHDIVDSLASMDEVAAWQRVGLLADVHGVDTELAVELDKAGIHSVGELARQDPDALVNLMHGIGRVEAGVNDAFKIILDATRVDLTVATAGQVIHDDGTAAAEVEVSAGYTRTKTDRNGYFRLARVAPLPVRALVIRSPNRGSRIVEAPIYTSMNEAIIDTVHILDASGDHNLSELAGDKMPPFSSFPIRSEVRTAANLREGDILVVHSFYARSKHAKLVSRLREFENGEFIAAAYKVPLGKIPNGTKLRDLLEYDNGKLIACDMNEAEIEDYRALLRDVAENPANDLLPPQ